MALRYSTVAIFVLFIAIVLITSGLYSELAYSQYAVFSLMLAIIFISKRYRNYITKFAKKRILVALLLSTLFLILILNSSFGFSFKVAVTPAISMIVFCVFYYFSLASFEMNNRLTENAVVWAIIVALLTVMYGQWLQSQGVVLNSQLSLTNEQISWQSRFGAFLNANQTGHIILMLLYSLMAIRGFVIKDVITIFASVLVATILLTIGSRAGFLFFAVICVTLFFKNFSKRKLVLLFVGVVVGLYIIILLGGSNTQDLRISEWFGDESPFERFYRQLVYDERYYIMLESYNSFLENPIFGNGYRYLYNSIGFSSHNEITENLTNFGLLFGGAILALTAILYKGHSRSALLICSPAFLFSHNFYDQPSIQAAIALTLFSSRVYQFKRV